MKVFRRKPPPSPLEQDVLQKLDAGGTPEQVWAIIEHEPIRRSQDLNPILLRELAWRMHHHTEPECRLVCCYILTWQWSSRLTTELLRLLERNTDFAEIRSQALEGLAEHLDGWYRWGPRRIPPRVRRAVVAIEAGLSDPDPEVRFWACFAAGKLKVRTLCSKLRLLAGADEGQCPRFWTVAEEASDTPDHIEGREPPERKLTAPPRERTWRSQAKQP